MQVPYPNVFIVGAAKAGTSSLVNMLRMHRSVAIPQEKEPHHFSLCGGRPWTIFDGAKRLPLAATLPFGEKRAYLGLYDADLKADKLKVDASTQYLVDESAARAIHSANPNARIIACLRDPVSRAYSAFLHARSRGEEPCERFAAALDECEAGTRTNAFAINYIEEGFYAQHLAVYQELFRDQLLILFFEDLVRDPQFIMDKLCEFLEIGKIDLGESEVPHKNPSIEFSNPAARTLRLIAKRLRRKFPAVLNASIVRRPYEWSLAKAGARPQKMLAADARRAYGLLADQIRATERLLGRELPHWHRP